ncbi:hypothetical protein [Rhodococcus artemisiae]|uniref:DUF3040 family protein n=1 Tax=Rhodococcus artemisiae TaxID=714159 RepID=A0ABU7LJ29_9NOCA|nr:hypothetical protein [Rhodococcus artemisiae]MEE2061573.1 hypothetical protein [Rhodococcus artemisiae]
MDDLDVPSVREVVGRYQNLRDSGRLPVDGDELEGAVWTVRRQHSQLSSEALLRGMFVGLLVMLAHAKFSSWAVDDALASVVFGALAVVVVWAIVRRSEQKRLVVFRAHADALLSRAETVEVAAPS